MGYLGTSVFFVEACTSHLVRFELAPHESKLKFKNNSQRQILGTNLSMTLVQSIIISATDRNMAVY